VAGEADLSEEWAAFAPEWIRRMASAGDRAREGLLDDWMLDVAGDVSGRSVIDLGCGEGRFCRMLAARGARTLGVDLQPAFIEHARRLAGPSETYELGDLQSLTGVPDASFDLAVSYISLVDVADEAAAVREASRVLVPGGRFVVCNLAPMATAAQVEDPWFRRADRSKVHYVLDDYADEGPRDIPFPSGHRITNHHRMLSTTVNGFLDAGFALRRLHEPLPDEEQLARVPDNEDLFRVPIFVIYDLHKPVGPSELAVVV
jgi:SAM-dependent methyltransferase